jgi:hypothetical protein
MTKYFALIMLVVSCNVQGFAADIDNILKLDTYGNDEIKELVENFEQYEQKLLARLVEAINIKASEMGIKKDDPRQLASLYLTYSQLVVQNIYNIMKDITNNLCETIIYPRVTGDYRDLQLPAQHTFYKPQHHYSLRNVHAVFSDISIKVARSCKLSWEHSGTPCFEYAVKEVIKDLLAQLKLDKNSTKKGKLYRYAYRLGVLYSLAYKADSDYLEFHFKPSFEKTYERLQPHYIAQHKEKVIKYLSSATEISESENDPYVESLHELFLHHKRGGKKPLPDR